MSMHCSSNIGKIRATVIVCCFLLIIGIFGYAYLADTNGKTVITKEEIITNVETLDTSSFDYEYVSSYVKKYGIGNLNSYKFNAIEQMLEGDFYKELPEESEMAKTVTLAFVEEYYDAIDLSDKSQVTDALIKCLFAALGDPYAYYRTQEEFSEYLSGLQGGEEFVGIGVMMNQETLEILYVYPDSGAAEAGMKSRDVIYAVEGKTLADISKDELLGMISGEPDTTVSITVKRGDELIDLTVTRRTLTERSVYYELTEDKIGIIQINQFLQDTYGQFVEAVDYCTEGGAVALVIDVRYNPGGLLSSVISVIDYLAPDAPERRVASYTQAGDNYVYYTSDNHSVDLPIAVICNEYTASAGELFTAAMRDYGAERCMDTVIVGTTTYGKGVVQTSYTLYDASGITYTIGYYNPPSDVNFDGIGVMPGIEVAETIGADAPLGTAIDAVSSLVNKGAGALGAAA